MCGGCFLEGVFLPLLLGGPLRFLCCSGFARPTSSSVRVIFKSGSKELNIDLIRPSIPLKIDNIIISAIVPIPIPAREIQEITLIIFRDFLEKRYLFAMKKGKFIILINHLFVQRNPLNHQGKI